MPIARITRLQPLRNLSSDIKTNLPRTTIPQITEATKHEVQAPNRASVWSKRQASRSDAMTGPRFVGVNLNSQPRPQAAIELIKESPIKVVEDRKVYCDGGGPLGHPRIYINLDDTNKAGTCGYCGARFQQQSHYH